MLEIKKSQWDELSDEEKFVYYKWFLRNCNHQADIGSVYQAITIGQLIEYLGDDLISLDNRCSHWEIMLSSGKIFKDLECINVCFKATKYKLRNKLKPSEVWKEFC